MAYDNITVERVEHKVPKKPPTKPPVLNERFRVVGGSEGANIQILYEDCSGRHIFTEAEAVEIAQRFLNDNPNPKPIPAIGTEKHPGTNSRYVLYTIGGKNIWVFIAWTYGLDVFILLPQNRQLEPIRTGDSADIPAFEITNKNVA